MRQCASLPVCRFGAQQIAGCAYPTLPCLAHALFCMPCHMRSFHAACRPICPAGASMLDGSHCMPGAVTHRALPLDARCTHVVRCMFWRPDVLILRRVLHALRHLYYTTGCAHAASPCPHGPQNLKGDFYNGRQPALRRRCGPAPSLLYARHTGKAWQSSLSPFTHQGRLFARAIIQLHFSGHCG